MLHVIEKETASEKVERNLSDSIFEGRFRAGEYLPSVAELAGIFSVSRNTVRQGLARLAAKRLVVVESGKGTRVANLLETATIDTLIDLASRSGDRERRISIVRQVLELVGAALEQMLALASTRHSPDHLEWHAHYIRALAERCDTDVSALEVGRVELEIFRVLAGAAGNIGCTSFLNSLRRLIEMPAKSRRRPGPLLSVECHWQLFELVRARDAAGATRVLAETFASRCQSWAQEFAGNSGGDPQQDAPDEVSLSGAA